MSGFDRVQTDNPAMQAAGREFSDRAQDFTGQLTAVNNQMGILQASWTGEASAAFNGAMDNWEQSFRAVINKLIFMAEALGQTNTAQLNTEADSANTAKDFASALPALPGV